MTDDIVIEHETQGTFDAYTSATVLNDLTRPSEAAFTVGDDASFVTMRDMLGLGNEFRVSVNGRLHLTGRVELTSVPCTPQDGSLVTFTIRTKLADAMYASADPRVRVGKGTTLKRFILDCYAPLGLGESDFVWLTDTSRDLMTGRLSGSTTPTELEPITEEQAKVTPPETIYAAVDKHLARHGLMHWDSPDGRIAVGTPNDSQEPLFQFYIYNDARSWRNNVLSATRTQDASSVPSSVTVVGGQTSQAWSAPRTVRGIHRVPELDGLRNSAGDLRIYHPVYIMDSAVRSAAYALRRAKQEATARSKAFDAWTLTVDGLSYRGNGSPVNYAVDTVCEIDSSLVGGPTGAYLIHAVRKTSTVDDGMTTELSAIRKGLWSL